MWEKGPRSRTIAAEGGNSSVDLQIKTTTRRRHNPPPPRTCRMQNAASSSSKTNGAVLVLVDESNRCEDADGATMKNGC